jgi:hypothetical protein
MNLRAYSSLAAFLAHYEVLHAARDKGARTATASALSSADTATLTAMEHIIAELSAADGAALTNDAIPPAGAIAVGDTARHRARAELHLRRLLAARGIISG